MSPVEVATAVTVAPVHAEWASGRAPLATMDEYDAVAVVQWQAGIDDKEQFLAEHGGGPRA